MHRDLGPERRVRIVVDNLDVPTPGQFAHDVGERAIGHIERDSARLTAGLMLCNGLGRLLCREHTVRRLRERRYGETTLWYGR